MIPSGYLWLLVLMDGLQVWLCPWLYQLEDLATKKKKKHF